MIPVLVLCLISIIMAVLPLFVRRSDVGSYTKTLYREEGGSEESLITLVAFLVLYALLLMSILVISFIYYALPLIPLMLIIYMMCRQPFRSRWVSACYLLNNFSIAVALICNMLMYHI